MGGIKETAHTVDVINREHNALCVQIEHKISEVLLERGDYGLVGSVSENISISWGLIASVTFVSLQVIATMISLLFEPMSLCPSSVETIADNIYMLT